MSDEELAVIEEGRLWNNTLAPRLVADLQAERAANARLREALEGLKHRYADEPCWCDMAIGNPMYSAHTIACEHARAALAADGG